MKVTSLAVAIVTVAAARRAAGLEFSQSDLDRARVVVRVVGSAPILPRLPIPLEIVVSNPTTETLVVPVPTLAARDNPYNTVDLSYVTEEGSEPRRVEFLLPTFAPWKSGVLPRRPELTALDGGDSTTVAAFLSYDWHPLSPRVVVDQDALDLSAELHALKRDDEGQWVIAPTGSLRSDTITVAIEPLSAEDAAARSEVEGIPHPWLLAHPKALERILQGADYEPLRRLVASHPASTYALYAKAALAFMVGLGDGLDLDPSRPADPAAGIVLIDEVLADPRFVLRDDLVALRERLQALLAGGGGGP